MNAGGLKQSDRVTQIAEETIVLAEQRLRIPNAHYVCCFFKKKNAIRFLQEGNRVKAVVQFRGREIAHSELGKKLLVRFAEDLAQYGAVESSPRMEGRNAHILISPSKSGKAS